MSTANDNIKDVSLAFFSTSALLLTILAVVHIEHPAPLLIFLAASGLYATIGFGVPVLLILIIRAREAVPHESEMSFKMMMFFLILQMGSFTIGLANTFWIVIAASH